MPFDNIDVIVCGKKYRMTEVEISLSSIMRKRAIESKELRFIVKKELFDHVYRFLQLCNGDQTVEPEGFMESLYAFPNNVGVLLDVQDLAITFGIPFLRKLCYKHLRNIVKKHLKNPDIFNYVLGKNEFIGVDRCLDNHRSYEENFVSEHERVESLVFQI